MSQEIELLLRKMISSNKEDRELVRMFFRDMLAGGPLWVVPALLRFVASTAALDELQFSRRIAGTIPVDDLPY